MKMWGMVVTVLTIGRQFPDLLEILERERNAVENLIHGCVNLPGIQIRTYYSRKDCYLESVKWEWTPIKINSNGTIDHSIIYRQYVTRVLFEWILIVADSQ
jgi:hypothetical protein